MPINFRTSKTSAQDYHVLPESGWLFFSRNQEERLRDVNLLLETLATCGTEEHIRAILIRLARKTMDTNHLPRGAPEADLLAFALSFASWAGMTIWEYAILAGAPARTFEILIALGFDAFFPRPFPHGPYAFVSLVAHDRDNKKMRDASDADDLLAKVPMVTSVGVSAYGAAADATVVWMVGAENKPAGILGDPGRMSFPGFRVASDEDQCRSANAALSVLSALRAGVDPLADTVRTTKNITPPSLTVTDVALMKEAQLFGWFGGEIVEDVIPLLTRDDFALVTRILVDKTLRHKVEYAALPPAVVHYYTQNISSKLAALGLLTWQEGELQHLAELEKSSAATQIRQFVKDVSDIDEALGDFQHWEYTRTWLQSLGGDLVQQQWNATTSLINLHNSERIVADMAQSSGASGVKSLACGCCGGHAKYTSGPGGALVCGSVCQAILLGAM